MRASLLITSRSPADIVPRQRDEQARREEGRGGGDKTLEAHSEKEVTLALSPRSCSSFFPSYI